MRDYGLCFVKLGGEFRSLEAAYGVCSFYLIFQQLVYTNSLYKRENSPQVP